MGLGFGFGLELGLGLGFGLGFGLRACSREGWSAALPTMRVLHTAAALKAATLVGVRVRIRIGVG